MFYTPKNDFTNFATMKKIALFVFLLLIAVISFGQTVPVQAKTLRVNWGSDNYSINLNGDSVLIDASDFIWFAKKFGSDTLLFGDGTYMTTAPTSGGSDTGYVKTTGDTITGSYRISGDDSYFEFYKDATNYVSIDYDEITLTAGASGVFISPGLLQLSKSILNINDVLTLASDTSMEDDASKVFTTVGGGWGEVYAFTSSEIIDEWAEFIFSSDGTVYLKSNSTDVSNIDEDGKLCIFDNGTSITIKNRLGTGRHIKYIIHY
jgi:hypothetical protein